jgi:ribosomal protein S6
MQKNAEMEVEELDIEATGLNDTAEDEAESLVNVYEIGYHLLPTVADDALPAAVKELTDVLAENGAQMVGEQAPVRMPLAYTLTKRVAGKITGFDEANFGWVAFEMPRANIARVKEAFDANPNVLRFLIITTSRDEVAANLSGAVAHLPTVRATGNIEKPKREAEEGGEVSEAALNEALKTIETEGAPE